MSSESERPIEKLLRMCARRKREQAGDAWQLHSATRRLLQQEVAQRLGPKPSPSPSWLLWLQSPRWLKPVAAFSVLALVAAGAWVFLHPSASPREHLLAKNEPAERQPGANPTGTLAVTQVMSQKVSPASASRISLRENNVRPETQEARSVSQGVELAKAPQNVPPDRLTSAQPVQPPASPAPASAPIPNLATSEKQLALSLTPAPGTAAPATGVPQAYDLGSAGQRANATLAQTWVRTAAAKSSSSSTALAAPVAAQAATGLGQPQGGLATPVVNYGYFVASQAASRDSLRRQRSEVVDAAGSTTEQHAQVPNPILASFQVQQAAGELRIIDGDGSVYSGPIQPTNASAGAAPTPGQTSPLIALDVAPVRNLKTTQPQVAQYLFQVVGTNRSSKARVSFSGVLNLETNLQTTLDAPTELSTGFTKQPQGTASSLRETLWLSGKAVVGRNEGFPVEASRVSLQPPGR